MTPQPKKRGRKNWTPTQRHLDTITQLYSLGISERTIAGACGVAHTTFSTKKQEFPEITEALNKGLEIKAERSIRAVELLWERIEGGSNGLLCFWLKTQEDWCEDGSEKIEREVRARLDQQREQIEREIGTKLRADADRLFSAMLDQFYARCAKELSEKEYDRIVDLFPTAVTWAENRAADQREASPETPDAQQP